MLLIGITGAIGHGKSTLADVFQEVEPTALHLESSRVIADVANELQAELDTPLDWQDLDGINKWLSVMPAVVAKITHLEPTPAPVILTPNSIQANPVEYDKLFAHLSLLQARPELLKQPVNDATKGIFRPLLQWIGGYVTNHMDNRAWYEELVRRAEAAGEQGTTTSMIGGLRFPSDGQVIHDHKGTVLKIFRPEAPQPDLNDPTEREREAIKHDAVVINNSSIDALRNCAGHILKDLRSGQLKTEYQAQDYAGVA